MPDEHRAPARLILKRSARHLTPHNRRGQLLFFLAVVVVAVLTYFTVRYNLGRTSAEPFSDLTNLMKRPLANANFP